ncbi:TIGR03364 family FAD-dependent oxidoreductase [Glutamicibacter sp.]|uniref:TIGR03364 family FAD-dependent oxidoreductase n=1 Tax=Glutamicibacter sp. TaxID=1931995 RepID=UPI0028BD68BB|nr:TIGR03364 family FAD-dependent oxidoreductase [Glutamicibacter sp.]
MNENNLSKLPETIGSADVVIVGAGIVGLAHAARALDAGYTVTVIERDHQAVGASVRNFGHCCITAQSGELYRIAQDGRPLWLDYARRAGFWAVESGAVVVAATDTEMQVLLELSGEREAGQVKMLSAEQVAAELGRTDTHGILGGALLRDDLRVDPRTTVSKLAAWIDAQPGGRVLFNTSALGFDAGEASRAVVRTSRGEIAANQVFVCVGHDVDYLFPQLAAEHQIKRCALQMARSAVQEELKVSPAILTATSMLRYEAFTGVPSADRLRQEVAARSPQLLAAEANIMFTQRPDGSLLVGDSHTYDLTQTPFLNERTSTDLLEEIEEILGAGQLEIAERWQGVYASSAVGPLLVADVADGVTIVSVTAGVGMTLSFGLAQRNIAHRLTDSRQLSPLVK